MLCIIILIRAIHHLTPCCVYTYVGVCAYHVL